MMKIKQPFPGKSKIETVSLPSKIIPVLPEQAGLRFKT
jgi:hypothetical protein